GVFLGFGHGLAAAVARLALDLSVRVTAIEHGIIGQHAGPRVARPVRDALAVARQPIAHQADEATGRHQRNGRIHRLPFEVADLGRAGVVPFDQIGGLAGDALALDDALLAVLQVHVGIDDDTQRLEVADELVRTVLAVAGEVDDAGDGDVFAQARVPGRVE